MSESRDLIASVTGPGWKYGLSRIVIEGDKGAVFIAGSTEPFTEFDVISINPSRGEGMTPAGPFTWRKRGSSCSYKLAKCKVSTKTITGWWNDYRAKNTETPDAPAEPDGEDLL